MKTTIQKEVVPVGYYQAVFVETKKASHGMLGPGCRYVFQLTNDQCCGPEVSRVTAAKATLRNNAGRMLAWLSGKDVSEIDINADVKQFIGKEYYVRVDHRLSGTALVGAVWPLPKD